MSNFNDGALNTMMTALTGEITDCSLHSADPGTTGINELSGGTYARQTVTFGAAVSGQANVNNAPVFDVPASGTVAYVGFWAGTSFRVGVQVTTESYSSNGGTYQLQNTTYLDVSNTV